jgi:flavin reductase (DIM6/NTAB) family NADH-FMN oxidoreductase RutF
MAPFVPGEETAREFRDALGRFATGVTIVTTMTDQGPLGITANSFASVSLDPPLVLWSPARTSRRFPAFEAATHYAIHVLGEDQRELCAHFSRDGFAFDALDWRKGDHGIPEIAGCLARFDCERTAAHDGGDHLIIVGRVLSAEARDGAPLVFSSGRYGHFTHAH